MKTPRHYVVCCNCFDDEMYRYVRNPHPDTDEIIAEFETERDAEIFVGELFDRGAEVY